MPKDAYHVEVYRGFRIVLSQDCDPENPRKGFENFGTMICFHGRYDLGDSHDYGKPTDLLVQLGMDEESLTDNANTDLGDGSKLRIVWKPLYLYDHSGLTMRTTKFTCPWDSGQVGIIYVTYRRIAETFGLAVDGETFVPTADLIAQAEETLEGEVQVYDCYLRGEVLGYQIFAPDDEASSVEEDEDPPTEDDDEFWMDDEEQSCWGYYGKDDALSAAKEAIDAIVEQG